MIILMKKPLKLKNRNRRISTFKLKFLVQFSRHTLGFSSYALPKGLILGIIGSKALSSASLISRYLNRNSSARVAQIAGCIMRLKEQMKGSFKDGKILCIA